MACESTARNRWMQSTRCEREIFRQYSNECFIKCDIVLLRIAVYSDGSEEEKTSSVNGVTALCFVWLALVATAATENSRKYNANKTVKTREKPCKHAKINFECCCLFKNIKQGTHDTHIIHSAYELLACRFERLDLFTRPWNESCAEAGPNSPVTEIQLEHRQRVNFELLLSFAWIVVIRWKWNWMLVRTNRIERLLDFDKWQTVLNPDAASFDKLATTLLPYRSHW